MGLASLHDTYSGEQRKMQFTSPSKCTTTVAPSQPLQIAIGILPHVDEELKEGTWNTKAPSKKLSTLGAGIPCICMKQEDPPLALFGIA